MVQATRRTRKQRIEAAIAYALERRWDLAVDENRALLEQQPDDIEAANRLGKALTELDDLAAAIAAYRRSLEIDPANTIARKNIARLQAAASASKGKAKEGRAKKAPGGETIRPAALIEESGKSTVFELQRPNTRALKRLSAGDPVQLLPSEEHGLDVRSSTRAVLGHLDPRAGQRLRRLIEGGNRYEGAVRAIGDGTVTVIVRETYRHPSLLDEASFLPPAPERRKSTPRAYTRSSVLQREPADALSTDDEDSDEADPWASRGTAAKANELEDAGFGEEGPDDRDEADKAEAADNTSGDDEDDVDEDGEPEDDDLKAELKSEFGKDGADDAEEGADSADDLEDDDDR